MNKGPPPIPSRDAYTPQSGLGTPGSMYQNMYGGSPYASSYSGYPQSYGMGYSRSPYGMPYSSYSSLNNVNNGQSFTSAAEMHAKPTFDTIQTAVNTVSSIATMFDSTYYALRTSFQAMVNVFEQFATAKMTMEQILKVFSLFRLYRWLKSKISGQNLQDIWQPDPQKKDPSGPNWPVWAYFGLLIFSPYFMWRMSASEKAESDANSASESPDWVTGPHFAGKALHTFQARNKDELSVEEGQEVLFAPKEKQPRVRGWLLATVDKNVQGLVPANHVKVLAKVENTPDLLLDNI